VLGVGRFFRILPNTSAYQRDPVPLEYSIEWLTCVSPAVVTRCWLACRVLLKIFSWPTCRLLGLEPVGADSASRKGQRISEAQVAMVPGGTDSCATRPFAARMCASSSHSWTPSQRRPVPVDQSTLPVSWTGRLPMALQSPEAGKICGTAAAVAAAAASSAMRSPGGSRSPQYQTRPVTGPCPATSVLRVAT